MHVLRYEPWSFLNKFSADINRLVGDNVHTAEKVEQWIPAVDIREEAGAYVLTADLPGVEPGDIEVTADKGVLTIQGVRQSIEDQEKDHYQRLERATGRFFRRFNLPDSVAGGDIVAAGKNGVLTVTIPKSEEVQPRRIAVN